MGSCILAVRLEGVFRSVESDGVVLERVDSGESRGSVVGEPFVCVCGKVSVLLFVIVGGRETKW